MSSFTDESSKTILNYELPKEKLSAILKNLNSLDLTDIKMQIFEQKRLVVIVSFRELLRVRHA